MFKRKINGYLRVGKKKEEMKRKRKREGVSESSSWRVKRK